jgi:large subunit ribosomal protein L4
VKVLARKSALTYKAQANNIVVVEDFNFAAPKTKEFVGLLNSLKLSGEKVLVVLPENNSNVVLSGRNLPKTKMIMAGDINTYDVMNAAKILMVNSSIAKIEETLNK